MKKTNLKPQKAQQKIETVDKAKPKTPTAAILSR